MATRFSSVSKDRFNFVFFFSIYKVQWWSEEIWSVIRCFLIAGEKGGMEDGVDLPLGRDAEVECRS